MSPADHTVHSNGMHLVCGYFMTWLRKWGKEQQPSSHSYSYRQWYKVSKISNANTHFFFLKMISSEKNINDIKKLSVAIKMATENKQTKRCDDMNKLLRKLQNFCCLHSQTATQRMRKIMANNIYGMKTMQNLTFDGICHVMSDSISRFDVCT